MGPKILTSVVPEVRALASPSAHDVQVLLTHIESERSAGALTSLRKYAERSLKRLDDTLNVNEKSLNAKARLTLETAVRGHAPLLAALVDHLDLLLESSFREGVALPLDELLVSRPDKGSERPAWPALLRGPASQLFVNAPARVSVRALSLFLKADGFEHPVVDVAADGPLIQFVTFEKGSEPVVNPGEKEGVDLRLPVLLSIPPSRDTARLVLERLGATFGPSPGAFTLPLVTP